MFSVHIYHSGHVAPLEGSALPPNSNSHILGSVGGEGGVG